MSDLTAKQLADEIERRGIEKCIHLQFPIVAALRSLDDAAVEDAKRWRCYVTVLLKSDQRAGMTERVDRLIEEERRLAAASDKDAGGRGSGAVMGTPGDDAGDAAPVAPPAPDNLVRRLHELNDKLWIKLLAETIDRIEQQQAGIQGLHRMLTNYEQQHEADARRIADYEQERIKILREREDWARRFKLNGFTPWEWMTRAEKAERDLAERGPTGHDRKSEPLGGAMPPLNPGCAWPFPEKK